MKPIAIPSTFQMLLQDGLSEYYADGDLGEVVDVEEETEAEGPSLDGAVAVELEKLPSRAAPALEEVEYGEKVPMMGKMEKYGVGDKAYVSHEEFNDFIDDRIRSDDVEFKEVFNSAVDETFHDALMATLAEARDEVVPGELARLLRMVIEKAVTRGSIQLIIENTAEDAAERWLSKRV